ncbi:MAG: histidine--tRNA ligase [Candidatus Omnitrophota bacterium]|nr:histidine--tRNA ligase [Candidatus Omnitrophota bacterium]
MYQKIPGTKDILPEEALKWQKIEELSRNVFSLYNYKEIRTPLIEEASLFNRSLGEASEIVQKQMFLINSAPSSNVTAHSVYGLRPEGTASVARSYIENNLDKTTGFVKLYYIGPMFRLERPQKGRLRQFHHIGVEAIGLIEPDLDVEIISLASMLLKEFSIEDYKIKINSLGCAKDKKELTDNLHKELKTKLDELCPDCQIRFKTNTLRILDCKNDICQKIIGNLNIKETYLCPECEAHFSSVKQGLDSLKITYQISPYLVRGLDYYTGIVFEITHPSLGALDALGAGGRYDNLIKELGGIDAGAVGFAFGIERLLITSNPKAQVPDKNNLVYIIPLGKEAKKQGLKLLDNLRREKIACDTDYENKSLKSAMRKANDLNAKLVLIIGEDELKKGVVTLKNMASGEQQEIKQDEIITALR